MIEASTSPKANATPAPKPDPNLSLLIKEFLSRVYPIFKTPAAPTFSLFVFGALFRAKAPAKEEEGAKVQSSV